jgi:hypothetical protein
MILEEAQLMNSKFVDGIRGEGYNTAHRISVEISFITSRGK